MSATYNLDDIDTKADVEHVDTPTKGAKFDTIDYVPGTQEEKLLLRKIDRHLIPMLWIMYVFNYIDRTNIGVSSMCQHLTRQSLICTRTPKWEAWRPTSACLRPTTHSSCRSSSL
jgi:hypothetical protein